MDSFEQAFKIVIGHEGGYTASPADAQVHVAEFY